MALDIKRYTHVPLFVHAVLVSAENMAEVAEWCGGTIQTDEEGKQFIQIATIRPLHERQTKAYVRDYVLKTDVGLKVYTARPFARGFVLAPEK